MYIRIGFLSFRPAHFLLNHAYHQVSKSTDGAVVTGTAFNLKLQGLDSTAPAMYAWLCGMTLRRLEPSSSLMTSLHGFHDVRGRLLSINHVPLVSRPSRLTHALT